MEPLTRRRALTLGALGLTWLTPLAHLLAETAEAAPRARPRRAVIVVRLAGGPSQLETFDPHAGTRIAAGTRAIRTAVRGVELAEGYEQLATLMSDVSLVRSLVSQEGDHERGTYLLRTGWRPNATVVHPSLGALACEGLPEDGVEIPRHVAILGGERTPKGGILGARYDAFGIDDPNKPIPDVTARAS